MSFAPSFSLDCKKCGGRYELDSFAIDTHTCQNKHVFFFKCPGCGGFTATAMANIPQQRWPEFVPAEQLDDLLQQFNRAMKKYG
jgi:hypothetical protein